MRLSVIGGSGGIPDMGATDEAEAIAAAAHHFTGPITVARPGLVVGV